MRENWNRATNVIELPLELLTQLVQPAFSGETVIESTHLQGGLANTNIRVVVTNQSSPFVIRFFVRDPEQAAKECAIYQLIGAPASSRHSMAAEGAPASSRHSVVPCPRLYYFAINNDITAHPYSISEWVDGVRLETLVPTMSHNDALELGESVGVALAAIHSFKFDKAGFFDAALRVTEEIEMGSRGLVEYAQTCLANPLVADRIGLELSAALIQFVAGEGKILDSWKGAPCLTHADFGGSNILVHRGAGAPALSADPGSPTSRTNGAPASSRHSTAAEGAPASSRHSWCVSAVLDWEFAFAGTPFFDFGNLLRPPLGDIASFEAGLVKGYTAGGGSLPVDWRQMSKITDLTAWLEFMTRPSAGPQLIADARRIIENTIHNRQTAR